ncbi:MAG: hypothetical protein F6K41_24660 [Symploca sp. SIO3E6]|nr:hypothetical protein [Caldora sp. SIO3E6]
MKCIRCDTDNELQDRTGNQGRCKNCNHPFAFDPTTMKAPLNFTDRFFLKVIQDISAQNTLFFTPKQLFYFLDRRLKQKGFGSVGLLIFRYLFSNISYSIIGNITVLGIIFSVFNNFVFSTSLPWIPFGWNLFCIYYLYNLSNSQKLTFRMRQLSTTLLKILGTFLLIIGIISSFYINSILIYWLTTIIFLIAFWLGFFQQRRIAQIPQTFLITGAQMEGWLDSWARANGSVARLLPPPSNTLSPASQNNLPDPDVTAYSFDRVVVCQSDAIAQMLIANNFHFEYNCAILSISGYPQGIFDTTMQMLHRNPLLQVFAFHDCSPQDMELVYQLRTANWFPDNNIVIVDLGLSPRQILATKQGMFIQNSKASGQAAQHLPPHIRENLSQEELQWLEQGNFVELESFTPQRLMQILHRGIANSQQMDTVEDNSFILVGDRDGYIYASESFG